MEDQRRFVTMYICSLRTQQQIMFFLSYLAQTNNQINTEINQFSSSSQLNFRWLRLGIQLCIFKIRQMSCLRVCQEACRGSFKALLHYNESQDWSNINAVLIIWPN